MKKVFLLFIFLTANTAFSYNYFEDTVWTKRTDQLSGFYMVKFSNNDSIIVGHGYQKAMFYRASDGEEIARLPFNAEVHFIENDNKFIQLAPSRDRLIIFDTKTLLPLDTLEHDDLLIGSIDITKNENIVVGVITGGIRIWDLHTGNILNTKLFDFGEGVLEFNQINTRVLCDQNSFILTTTMVIKDPENPNNQLRGTWQPIYNLFTLDSVDSWDAPGARRVSNNCKYISFRTSDPDNGVQLWDFEKREFLHHIPVNGPSLTGMEFSPDDKYLVTSNRPGANQMIISSTISGELIWDFPKGTYSNISVSNSGNNILSATGGYLFLWNAPWIQTSKDDIREYNNITILPNPTSGQTKLIYEQEIPDIITISLSDMEGKYIKPLFSDFLEQGKQEINIDLSDQSSGMYLMNVKTSLYTKSFKIIVER